MSGPPVELFVPPGHIQRAPVAPLPLPVLSGVGSASSLLVGMAAIDHSGRLRDKALMAALGWQPGDRLAIDVSAQMAVLRRDADGPFVVDSRGQVFLPAATRTLFGVATGDRVVVAAVPESGLLMVHPVAVVTALLVEYYASQSGGPDAR